jgi:hypothetical protein
MPTYEIAGLKPTLSMIIDGVQQFIGDAGTGAITLSPAVAADPVVVPLPNGVSLKLPSTLDLSYKKSGQSVTIYFAKRPSAIVHGISVDIASAQVDLDQLHINLAGFAGVLTSITLKATS